MTWDPYCNLVRMAASPADMLNLHGTEHGLFLGPGIPLIAIILNKAGAACFAPTPQADLESWLGIAYGGDVDLADHMPILEQVAAAYNRGALVQALIAAARVRLPPLDRAGLERLARAGLIKANFNPNEPRDGHGRWTTGGDSTASRDDQATPPLVFRRPAAPLPSADAGSGTARVELVKDFYDGPDMGYVARRFGISRKRLRAIIHEIKPDNGLLGGDNLRFYYNNGDIYFHGEHLGNLYD